MTSYEPGSVLNAFHRLPQYIHTAFQVDTVIIPIYKWGHSGTNTLSNTHKVTQLIMG